MADTPRVPPTPDAESGAASSAERTDTVAFSDGTATEVLASTGTTGTDSTGNTDSTDTAVLGDDAATAVIAGSEATTTAMPAAPAADLPATAASTAATTAYPAAGAPAAYAASAGYSQPGPVPGYAAPAADSGYDYAAPSAGASYGYGGGVPPHGGYAPAAPVTPKPPRPKSTMANLITIGSALVAVGIILGLDRLTDLSGGWGVGAPVVVLCCAAALAVLALGIIIQGLRGRGAVLLSVLAIFGVITVAGTTLSTGSLFHVSQFSSQGISSGSGSIVAGDQRFVPGTVADAESGFTATASDVTVDLSRIADRGTDNVQVSIDVTMSDLEVILPRDATAKIITRSSLSSVDISDDFLQSVSHGAHTTDGSNVILIGSAQPDFIIEITGTASDIDIDTNR